MDPNNAPNGRKMAQKKLQCVSQLSIEHPKKLIKVIKFLILYVQNGAIKIYNLSH